MPQYVHVEWFIEAKDMERMRAYALHHKLETPAQVFNHLLEQALGGETTNEPVVSVRAATPAQPSHT